MLTPAGRLWGYTEGWKKTKTLSQCWKKANYRIFINFRNDLSWYTIVPKGVELQEIWGIQTIITKLLF